MKVGSLFSGIGGFDLGLERAGMQVVWQVENDPFCNKVLAKHWPNVKRCGDIKDCGKHNLEPVDLICGGFPCQDVSLAGKRKGLENGTRSGLWSEYARIIRELRPRYVLVENVPGLLSAGFGRVLGDLAESGYDAEWDCLPAAAFGAPHLRYRIFLVANTQDADRGRTNNTKHPRGWNPQARRCGESPGRLQHWSIEPGMDRVAYGIPNRIHRNRALGNAIVPQIAEFIGRQIMKYENGPPGLDAPWRRER